MWTLWLRKVRCSNNLLLTLILLTAILCLIKFKTIYSQIDQAGKLEEIKFNVKLINRNDTLMTDFVKISFCFYQLWSDRVYDRRYHCEGVEQYEQYTPPLPLPLVTASLTSLTKQLIREQGYPDRVCPHLVD